MKYQIILCILIQSSLITLICARTHKKDGARLVDCVEEEWTGCRLFDGRCQCGVEVGCKNPFPYISEHQCHKELSGELDKCLKEPCETGQCVQVRTEEGFRSWECSCAGSGFYGKRCQHKCPSVEKGDQPPKDYPTDCIY